MEKKNDVGRSFMKKRWLSILFILCMSLALLPGTARASAENGRVDLKPTSELNWIDRVELPDYALTLYETLEEAADGDGYKDYLIDDEYYDLEGDNIRTDMPGEFMRGTVTSSDGSTTRYTAYFGYYHQNRRNGSEYEGLYCQLYPHGSFCVQVRSSGGILDKRGISCRVQPQWHKVLLSCAMCK